MTFDDVKRTDWKHIDVKTMPHSVQLGLALILLGVLLLAAGLLL